MNADPEIRAGYALDDSICRQAVRVNACVQLMKYFVDVGEMSQNVTKK